MAIVKNFLYKVAQNTNPNQIPEVVDFVNLINSFTKDTKPETRKQLLQVAQKIHDLNSDQLKSFLSDEEGKKLLGILKSALSKLKDMKAYTKMDIYSALRRIIDHAPDDVKKALEEELNKVKPGFGTRIAGFFGKEGLGYGVATGTGVGVGALTGYLEARKGMPSWVSYTLPIGTGAASSLLTEYLLPKEYRPERFGDLFKGERFKQRWKQLAGKFAAHYLAAILTNKIMQKILRRKG